MDVIVNADDLGMSPEVNEGIFRLMGQGVVTSSTIIANAPSTEDACRRISSFPECSFGVHLNVTEFRPLSPPAALEPILDGQGAFAGEQIRRINIDKNLAEGIFQEFSAQIEMLRSLGVTPSHIDSHHYVHTIPKLFPVLKRVQKRFQIRKARITRNIYADGLNANPGLPAEILGVDPELGEHDVSRTVRVKKWIYNILMRRHYRTKTTDGFSGFRLFYEHARSRKMDHRTFEVTVHPANPYYHPSEIEILEGGWQDEVRFPVRLISYNELD